MPEQSPAKRRRAIAVALFVTFLWSTSWVLIKIGLESIPPLTFAGLRYMLAAVLLLPFSLRKNHIQTVRSLEAREWGRLLALGVVLYTLTQGGQFFALAYLEAVTFSLLLSMSPLIVAVLGIFFLRERPVPLQWAGIGVFLVGTLVYFLPLGVQAGSAVGFLLAALTVCAGAIASLLARAINQAERLSPLLVTQISMGIGALILLGVGIATQGLPLLSVQSWLIVGWLAAVNTAFAFTLWNLSLKTLTAVESSVINNTMLVQIALLAWLFLGEGITPQEGVGLLLAAAGIILVQVKRQ